MDTQNVSAQLYFKQLPADSNAGIYNCQNTYPNLSTCVDNVKSDVQIENAFQQQLDLSEYYKSPEVFETVKKNFMDQTMEAEINFSTESVPETPPSIPAVKMSGPTDFLYNFIKEGFGSTSSSIGFVILGIVIFAILIAFAMNGNVLFNVF